MTTRRHTGGAAIPGGRPVVEAKAASPDICVPSEVCKQVVAPVNLAEALITSGAWPVRDQGHRSTCNAFAVVAAEELADFRATGILPRYSEECLYRAIRKVDTGDALNNTEYVDPAALAATGATFLAQAHVALRRGGLVPETGPPYDTNPLLPANYIAPAPQTPARPVNAACDRSHAIAASPAIQPAIDWRPRFPEGKPLSQIFLEALHDGKPIVAALPILQVPGTDLFKSAEAVQWGRTAYPPESALRPDHRAVAGHSVCIVGYAPQSDDRIDGWFMFRNSYGTRVFAREADRDSRTPRALAPGYGLIPATQVERFCWEFLIRN